MRSLALKPVSARILLLLLAALAHRAEAAEEKQPYEIFGKVVQGYVAFCRSTEVDELAVIGEPRRLAPEEVDKLAALLNSERTWYVRRPTGELMGMSKFCLPMWDFKFLLTGYRGEPIVSMRFCSSCSQVSVMANYAQVELPCMLEPGTEPLLKMLDGWFPDWRARTKQNRVEWSKRPKPEDRKKPAATEAAPPAGEGVQNRP